MYESFSKDKEKLNRNEELTVIINYNFLIILYYVIYNLYIILIKMILRIIKLFWYNKI